MMKKITRIIKNNILGIIISVFLGFSIEVMAASVASTSISYSNSKTAQTTVNGALNELIEVVNINNKVGNTDISLVGDGTVTGAVKSLYSDVTSIGDTYYNYKSAGGGWKYRYLGDNLYHVVAKINYTSQAITTKYGNLYFKLLTIPLPSLPFDTWNVRVFNAQAYSSAGLLTITNYGLNLTDIQIFVSNSTSGTYSFAINFSMLVSTGALS